MASSANGMRTFDQPTTQALLAAFDECEADCKSIRSRVDSQAGMLSSGWRGAAAQTYINSMTQWIDSFNTVQQALDGLGAAMAYYRQMTGTVETNNQGTGGSWAAGA